MKCQHRMEIYLNSISNNFISMQKPQEIQTLLVTLKSQTSFHSKADKYQFKRSVRKILFIAWMVKLFHFAPTYLPLKYFICVWSLKKHQPQKKEVRRRKKTEETCILEITEGAAEDMVERKGEIGLKCRRNNMKIFILAKNEIPNFSLKAN